ncbi:MAG TPA: CPBP family intramembrane glutamic endopeptidase [Verrucomicrobiae bacterium]|nr:CPBP family intramembrane glutamic endopeptidase [Verrucomicrobiae bacterium]
MTAAVASPDRRPTLLEGISVFLITWYGFSTVWWNTPLHFLHGPYVGSWSQHVWMAVVPLACCAVFGRRIPLGSFRRAELQRWIVPGVATLALSVLGLFIVYLSPLRPLLASQSRHGPGSLLFEAIAPGLGEEVLFRGWLQTALNRSFPRVGTFVASLAFGYIHLSNQGPSAFVHFVGAYSVLIGLGLGIGYARSGNLWIAIILHNVADLLNMAILAVLP